MDWGILMSPIKPFKNGGVYRILTSHMMRKIVSMIFLYSGLLSAQTLSPEAQTLYTAMFNNDPFRGNYALTNGAVFYSSPDSSSFYLQWFPNGSAQPDTLPIIVTCHGSEGKVFDEFYLWHPYAMANNCGIIAIQWYNPDSTVWGADHYLKDSVIYQTIDLALGTINYPSGKALFHGFSRGSARSYAINLYDHLSANNYFCTTISNAGSAEPGYPLYHDIDLGMYGTTPFLGRHWALYCGQLDPGVLSWCPAMVATQNWLTAKGAIVDVFIQDATGTHGGFHMNSNNVDSIITYYLQCFNGTVGVETIQTQEVVVYPNPNNGVVYVKTLEGMAGKDCMIEIYDMVGKLQYKRPLLESAVYLADLHPGSYVYVVYHKKMAIKRGNMVVH
jgi:hypothetical protein